MLYAGAIGIIGLVVPIITVPIATGTVIKEWSDRALDVYRLNLRENRPAVELASARVADYFHQRGLSGAALQQETSMVLGGFATLESVAHGFRSGLRFLSLMMLGIGLPVATLAGPRGAGAAGAARIGLHLIHSARREPVEMAGFVKFAAFADDNNECGRRDAPPSRSGESESDGLGRVQWTTGVGVQRFGAGPFSNSSSSLLAGHVSAAALGPRPSATLGCSTTR